MYMKKRHIIEIINPSKKPALIVVGGMHGNETSGINAIENIIDEIKNIKEYINGSIYFLKGNISAIENGERFIDKDLNRLWTSEYINSNSDKIADIKELNSLHELIFNDICNGNFKNCIFLDLHTFSANSGIFCIPASNQKSLDLAASFRIPFIEKLADSLPGTALSYFGNKGMTSIVVEGGTHGSKQAVENLEAAIWHILGYIGFVAKKNKSVIEAEKKLESLGKNYPYHLELSYRHQLENSSVFKMKEGYHNFKKIKKEEVLAVEHNKTIKSPNSGYMLMPLYQKKGSDGFFIVEEIKDVYQKTEI